MPSKPPHTAAHDAAIDRFIAYWQGQQGGQERANYQLFLIRLTEALGLPPPDAAGPNTDENAYVFERAVTFREPDGTTSTGRIDLYRRGSFVLEAKQSRQPGQKKAIAGQNDLFVPESEPRGERAATRAWDVLMLNARRQAEDYAKALPTTDGWPPFLLVCDVGHCIEVFADFSGQGKNYSHFPDRNGYRIYWKTCASRTSSNAWRSSGTNRRSSTRPRNRPRSRARSPSVWPRSRRRWRSATTRPKTWRCS